MEWKGMMRMRQGGSLRLREDAGEWGRRGRREQDLLAKLLALVSGELGGAGAHDRVRGRDVVPLGSVISI